MLDPDTREQWARDAEHRKADEERRAREAQSPDAAIRRAAAVSEVVAALVKVDAPERESVIAAARAILGSAPPQAHAIGANPSPTYTAR